MKRISVVQPPPYTLDEPPEDIIFALRRAFDGTANDEQQRMLMTWIVETLCEVKHDGYFPESIRDSDFAAGKRWVGLRLKELAAFVKEEENKD